MVHSRWRAWARRHPPSWLYDHGLVVPKVADCGRHEWYVQSDALLACYHCTVNRENPEIVMAGVRKVRRGNRRDGTSINALIDERRR